MGLTPPENNPLLVHVDEHMAVVDKPAGLIVHAAPGHVGTTLVDELGDLLGGGEEHRPGIVHRLDRDTSGLMLVARDAEAHRRLAAAIKAREVDRFYLALVEGKPRSRTGVIDAPLGRDHRSPEKRAIGGRGARDARTEFEVVETMPGYSLVRAKLETGRTHQVRVHMAAIGHPLAGDVRYGGGLTLGLERQFLHSTEIGFEHPFSGARMRFESPLPDDLAAALERARNPESGPNP